MVHNLATLQIFKMWMFPWGTWDLNTVAGPSSPGPSSPSFSTPPPPTPHPPSSSPFSTRFRFLHLLPFYTSSRVDCSCGQVGKKHSWREQRYPQTNLNSAGSVVLHGMVWYGGLIWYGMVVMLKSGGAALRCWEKGNCWTKWLGPASQSATSTTAWRYLDFHL